MKFTTVFAALCALQASAAAQAIDIYDPGIVRTLRLEFSDPGWHDHLTRRRLGEIGGCPTALTELSADLTVLGAGLPAEGLLFENVSVEYRGQSTLRTPLYSALGFIQGDCSLVDWATELPMFKAPWAIRLDQGETDREIGGVDTLRLNNGVMAENLVTEVVIRNLMTDYLPGTRANWIRVEAGLPGALEYIGLYQNVEHLDSMFQSRHFHRGPDGEFGYRYDHGDLEPLASVAQYMAEYEPEAGDEGASDAIKVGPVATPAELIEDFATLYLAGVSICDAPVSAQTFLDDLSKYLDIDEAVRFLAYWALIGENDGRASEILQDTHHANLVFVPQGLDRALVATSACDASNQAVQQWLRRALLQSAETRERYMAHLRTMASEVDPVEIGAWLASIESMLAAELDGRYEPETAAFWEGFENQGWSEEQIGAFFIQIVMAPDLADDIAEAMAQLEANIATVLAHPEVAAAAPTVHTLCHQPVHPLRPEDGGGWVNVTAHASGASDLSVRLFYRAAHGWRWRDMTDAGNAQDDGIAGNGVWGYRFDAALGDWPFADFDTVEYFVQARHTGAGGPAARCLPARAGAAPQEFLVARTRSPLALSINELCAINERRVEDPCGDTNDWVELVNLSGTALDLSGYELVADPADLGQGFVFPENTWIGSLGTLLVWCDEEPGENSGVCNGAVNDDPNVENRPGVHGFPKLSRSGGQVLLVSSTGQLVDFVRYKRNPEDASYARTIDGSGSFEWTIQPTPGEPNGLSVFGDLNGDGLVNTPDLLILLGSMGTSCCGGGLCPADLNHDEIVNTTDVLLFLSAFGS